MSARAPMRVLIVEDLRETAAWLAGIVSRAFPGARVRQAAGVRAALGAIAAEAPDLALVDLGLPDGEGLEVLRALRARAPACLPVVTTAATDDAAIVGALAAGAQGYLLKSDEAEVIGWQLARQVDGIPALSPAVARRVMDHFRATGPVAAPDGALTPREAEVLGLIGRGLRVPEAAEALGLAPSTVTSHVKSIYRKLGVASRAEAAMQAARMGLLGG